METDDEFPVFLSNWGSSGFAIVGGWVFVSLLLGVFEVGLVVSAYQDWRVQHGEPETAVVITPLAPTKTGASMEYEYRAAGATYRGQYSTRSMQEERASLKAGDALHVRIDPGHPERSTAEAPHWPRQQVGFQIFLLSGLAIWLGEARDSLLVLGLLRRRPGPSAMVHFLRAVALTAAVGAFVVVPLVLFTPVGWWLPAGWTLVVVLVGADWAHGKVRRVEVRKSAW